MPFQLSESDGSACVGSGCWFRPAEKAALVRVRAMEQRHNMVTGCGVAADRARRRRYQRGEVGAAAVATARPSSGAAAHAHLSRPRVDHVLGGTECGRRQAPTPMQLDAA